MASFHEFGFILLLTKVTAPTVEGKAVPAVRGQGPRKATSLALYVCLELSGGTEEYVGNPLRSPSSSTDARRVRCKIHPIPPGPESNPFPPRLRSQEEPEGSSRRVGPEGPESGPDKDKGSSARIPGAQ